MTNKPNFTPWPWEISYEEEDCAIIRGVDGEFIARLALLDDGECFDPNATLIITAPELRDILIEILDNCVVNGVYREKAEKILKKARGEE